ncbi:MAG TPA: DUF2807 domain-containing protein [Polyangiales bacterium]|nr:DUF2807 domain-containing protein [Polyangiales bacterium]
MPSTDYRAQSTPAVVGSGVIRERIITAPPFARLHIASAFRATFSLDPDFQDHVTLRFRADDNVLPYVQARLREGVLHVSLNHGHYRGLSELSVSARVGELSELACGGSSRVYLLGNARNLRIAAGDASDVSFEGSTDRMSLIGHGTASLRVERATDARIELAGASRARIVARRSIVGRVRFPCQLSLACPGTVQIAGAYRSE